jgi:hypothetical protein
VAGTDYTATSGTLTFAPGVTSQTVNVPITTVSTSGSTKSFTMNLSSPVNATISRGTATGSILNRQTKFFVADGGAFRTYEYGSGGTSEEITVGDSGNTASRGVATTAAGTTVWVVDANKTVYVYDNHGVLLGSWSAGGLTSSATLTGIATNGTDIWLVDSNSSKVYNYNGAANLRSGSQNANSSFKLSRSNSNATDMVTDGTSFWVVNANGASSKVFKYNLSGSSLGNWAIDPANTNPTGITINPNNVSDIWIVDNITLKVYQYVGAASRTSGSQNAAASFALAANNTNPQGIADPPVLGELLPPAPAAFAASLPVSTVLGASTPGRASAFARVTSLVGQDAMWATLSGDILRTANEPIRSFAPVIRTLTPSSVSGERNLSDLRTSLAPVDGAGSETGTAELLKDALAADDSQASTSAMDTFFAMLADRPISD